MKTTRPIVRNDQQTETLPDGGRRRVVIEGVEPEIDCGRFPIKRVVGDRVVVEADVFTDGHDQLSGVLRYRAVSDAEWSEMPLQHIGNDRWRAEFPVASLGRHEYTLEAWVDHFKTWRAQLAKRIDAGQDVALDLRIGANLVEETAQRATGEDGTRLRQVAEALRPQNGKVPASTVQRALGTDLAALLDRYPDRSLVTSYPKVLEVVVDRERARYGAWYELF